MKENCDVCKCSLKNKASFWFNGDIMCSSAICIHRYILQRPSIEYTKKTELLRILRSHMVRDTSRYMRD